MARTGLSCRAAGFWCICLPMQRVLILGATSAVAAEVAVLHAARGDRLHLVGRDPRKLAALVSRLGGGERVTQASADFSRLDACADIVAESIRALGGLDRALIAHGLLGDQLASERAFAEAEAILQTNLLSVIALLIPLANHFESARAGRLCVITSVAGDRGRPRNYTYGTAKGALNLYLQGVRSRLWRSGARVTAIKLGPVDSPMTVSHQKNALFARADQVAPAIVRAMDRGAGEVYAPSFWAAIMLLVRAAPEWLFQRASFLSGRD